MAIDLLNNRLGEILEKSKMLNDYDAWIQLNTPLLKHKVIRWIQDDQLISKGVDGDGQIIGYYTLGTEIISEGRKPEGEPYNLYDSGDLFASMFIVVLERHLQIGADTNEIKDQDWFRTQIFELTDENFARYILEAKEGLRNYLHRS